MVTGPKICCGILSLLPCSLALAQVNSSTIELPFSPARIKLESVFRMQGANDGIDNLPFESIRQYVFSSDAAIKLGLANAITAEAGRDSSMVIMEYSRYALVTQEERVEALRGLEARSPESVRAGIAEFINLDVRQASTLFPTLSKGADVPAHSTAKKVTFKYGISMRYKFWLKNVTVGGRGKLFGFIDLGGSRFRSEVSGLEGDLIGVSHPELTKLILPDITSSGSTAGGNDGPGARLSAVSVQTVMKGFRDLVQKLGTLQLDKNKPVYNPMLFGAFEEVPAAVALDPKKFQSGAVSGSKKGN